MLGRRPGEKIRSGIVKPAAGPSNEGSDDDLEITPSKDDKTTASKDDDDDLEIDPVEGGSNRGEDLEIDAASDDENEEQVGRPSKRRRLSVPEDEFDEEPLEFPDSDDE